jgi:hypothetical protein
MTIDAKLIGLLGLCLTQLGLAIWWAGEKTSDIAHIKTDIERVERDLVRLTQSIDAKMVRIEAKIDLMAGRN